MTIMHVRISRLPISAISLQSATKRSVQSNDTTSERVQTSPTILVAKGRSGDITIQTSTGKVFSLPVEMKAAVKYFDSCLKNRTYVSLLSRKQIPGMTEIQILPDRTINLAELDSILSLLSQAGYETFQIAHKSQTK